jgi:PAS domain S-box-containing protein
MHLDFQKLFEAAPGLFLVFTPDLRIVAVSEQYLRATMTRREKILGQLLFDVFPANPDDPCGTGIPNLRSSLDRVMRNRVADTMAVQKYDIRRPEAEGGGFEERYWSAVNSPVFGPNDELECIIHRVEDVTEFVRLQQRGEAQDEAAEQLRKRASQMEVEIYLRAQEVQSINQQLARANGAMQAEIEERIAAERKVESIAGELRRLNEELEERVGQRTAELAEMNRKLSHEISERQNAQERFRLAVESAPNAMTMVDKLGQIVLVNCQTERLFGYSRDELLGRSIEVLVPDRFRKQHPIDRASYFADPTARPMGMGRDLFGRRKDGTEFPVEIGLNPIRTSQGLFVLSAIVDITERKRAEVIQRQVNLRFRAIFNQTFEFVKLLSVDGVILEVNQPALDFRGLKAEDVVGQPLWETPWFDLSAQSREEARQAVTRAAAGHFVRQEITVLDHHGEQRTFDFSVKPVINDAGSVELLIQEARDITDQKKLEDQLRQAQKTEAVGALAGGIAHEFNNLLQTILGYTQFAMVGLSTDEKRHQDLQLVVKAAERATSLTRQLLTFARRQVLNRTQVDPNQVAGELVTMLRPLIGESIEVQTNLAPNVSTIFADAGQLQQVLLNLCINARDAMPQGGRLIIRTENVSLSPQFCEAFPGAQPGPHVLLSVADTGCGMSPEVKEHIFEPFYTTKERGKGTGLGLPMVYGMVKQHGGLIHVYSEPGAGTTFRIYLPANLSGEIVGPAPMHVDFGGGNETILVAEDDPLVRGFIARVLEGAGYQTLAATNGAEALDLFRQHRQAVALALLDAVMPCMGGHEVCQRLKASCPDLPVVFCTGHDPDVHQVGAIAAHGLPILQKPVDPILLLQTVRSALDSRKLNAVGALPLPSFAAQTATDATTAIFPSAMVDSLA